jgi:hypothetical protein
VHHQVEDLSYFPLFRAAEPRLVRGFEVLEHDHDILHERIARLADAANAFLEASEPTRCALAPTAIASSPTSSCPASSATSPMRRI